MEVLSSASKSTKIQVESEAERIREDQHGEIESKQGVSEWEPGGGRGEGTEGS